MPAALVLPKTPPKPSRAPISREKVSVASTIRASMRNLPGGQIDLGDQAAHIVQPRSHVLHEELVAALIDHQVAALREHGLVLARRNSPTFLALW